MRRKPREAKEVRSGRRDDGRRASEPQERSRTIIFGVLPVVEALRAATRRVDKILISESAKDSRLGVVYDLCRERSIAWSQVPLAFLERFVEAGVNHQGVVALVSAAGYAELEDALGSASVPELFLILDGVEDPGNLGAILRTAECSGVDGIFIPERRAVGLTDTVAKASAGAIEHVKVVRITNLNRLIEH